MQLSFWLIAFIVGVVQGVLLTAALLTMRTGNRRATTTLAALVAVFTVMILGEVIHRFVPVEIGLWLTGININTELAIGPLFLLFVRSLFDPDRSGRTQRIGDSRHFLPMLAGLVVWLIIVGAMNFGAVDLTEQEFHNVIAPYVVLKAIFLFTYLSLAYRELNASLADSRRLMAGRRPVELHWLRRWLLGLGFVASLIYLTFFLGYFGAPVPDSDNVGSLILALMIYLMSMLVLSRPWVLSLRPRQADLERFAGDIERIEDLLENERRFLDPELTLGDLSGALGLSENRLSSVINDGMNTSFYELMAHYRLREFERLARDPQHRHRPVLELAYASGFNSKASFYRVFRQSHGTTPTAFRKQAAS